MVELQEVLENMIENLENSIQKEKVEVPFIK